MKKILVIALAVIMVVSALALTACVQPQTVTGECMYENKHGTKYGVKVDVTVQGDIITAVKLYTDEETGWVRTSSPMPEYGWTQEKFDAVEGAYEAFLNKFVGMTVAEVNAIVATATAEGQSVTTEGWAITGGTVSSARIIVAVQNALSKLAA